MTAPASAPEAVVTTASGALPSFGLGLEQLPEPPEVDDWDFGRAPWAHQRRIFYATRAAEYHAYFLEQRTGKTFLTLHVMAWQAVVARRVDRLLVIAQNGVHSNWVRDEVPANWPGRVPLRTYEWSSARSESSRSARAELEDFLTTSELTLLAVNHEALITPRLRDVLTRYFRRHRVFVVFDESVDLADVRSQRTQVALRVAARAVSRRTLDGTPADRTPLGLYAQCEFLRPGLLGFPSFPAFRARYARLRRLDVGERDRPCLDCRGREPAVLTCERCRGSGLIGERTVQLVAGYQRLEELGAKLAPFATRVRRADCADLPPKISQRVRFDLTPTQRRVYTQLREEALAELRGGTASAPLALTRLLRLQQVTSNFVTLDPIAEPCRSCDGGDPDCVTCEGTGFALETPGVRRAPPRWERVDERANPRVDALRDVVRRLDGPGVIWARFQRDYADVAALAAAEGWSLVTYTGAQSADEKHAAKTAFQGGEARILLANYRAAARGLNFSVASWNVFYSHDWSVLLRHQAEDRTQTLARRDSVLYVDLVASDTVDERVLDALASGRTLAEQVLGDPPESWLREGAPAR